MDGILRNGWTDSPEYAQAELCKKHLSKGSRIYVEGRLETSNYEKENQTHYITKIVVSNFQFLGGKQNNHSSDDYQKYESEPISKIQDQVGSNGSFGEPSNEFKGEDVPF